MNGTPGLLSIRDRVVPVCFLVVASLLTVACFNIVLEEAQPQTDSMTVMPVLGDINLLPGPQASNPVIDNLDRPGVGPAAGRSVPTLTPGATDPVAHGRLPAYRLTINGVPVVDFTLTLEGGRVEVSSPPDELTGLYADADRVQLTAIAGEGYRFDAWQGDCIRDGGVCSVTFDGDKDLIAGFVPLDVLFKLELIAEPEGGGKVQVEPSPNAADGRYANGTPLDLKAIGAEGYRFNGWDGACSGSNRECRLIMDADHSVRASFAPNFYTLTINRVLVDGAGVPLGQGQLAVFPFGASPDQRFAGSAVVSLTPGTTAGYAVVNWGGDCAGLDPGAPACLLAMDRDRFVEIIFAPERVGPESDGPESDAPESDGPESDDRRS